MGEIIRFDYKEFQDRDYSILSMGIKPSGNLHLGSVVALTNGFLYLKDNPDSKLNIGVMDLDFDVRRGDDFLSFYNSPDKWNCHRYAKEHTKSEIEEVSRTGSECLGLDSKRINIRYFSDMLNDEGLMKMFVRIAMDRDLCRGVKKAIADRSGRSYKVPFSPICPECGRSNSNFAVVSRENETLKGKCSNSGCEVEDYEVSLKDKGSYNIHYLIDPIRDVSRSFKADVHIFGGDYDTPWGEKKISRTERVMNVMGLFSRKTPDIYLGPVFTVNGKKMSKTLDNTIDFASLENPKDLILRLADMIYDNKSEIKHEDL
jgi:lysyl-tRNA synthetase class I